MGEEPEFLCIFAVNKLKNVMADFKTGPAGGLSHSRTKGTKVTLAGRPMYLPNMDVQIVVQKLTQRQIAAIPRDKFAVAVIEPGTTLGEPHASKTGIALPFGRRKLRYYRNVIRYRNLTRFNRPSATGDGTKEYTTVITLLRQVEHHVETLYYDNRELSRNDKNTPSPSGDIFLTPVDAGKMSDCIKRIILDVFGNGDKGKICNREIKLVEFCLLMHYYFNRIKILDNTSRQPFCEYLENYVFADQSRFTAKTFNNYANDAKYKKAEPLFTDEKLLSINFKKHPIPQGTLQDAFHEIGCFFHNSPYFDELREMRKNIDNFRI